MSEKKRINSKAKGSEYERKIAKVLGAWWKEDFHRTPASGGLHWAEDNRVAGDIVTPPDSVYPWVTELKKRENWQFDHLVKGVGDIEKFWDQVLADTKRVGLRPLLIFAKNFSPNYLMIELEDFLTLKKQKEEEPPFNYFIVRVQGSPDRIVCILEEFTKYFTKQDVISAFNL